MGFTGALSADADIMGVSFVVAVPKGGYARFLLRMIEMSRLAAEARGTANRWSAEWCVLEDEDDSITFKPASEKKANALRLRRVA